MIKRLILGALCVVVIGCEVKRPTPPKFAVGEIAKLAVSGEEVQVCYVLRCYPAEYKCRVKGFTEGAEHGLVSMRTVTRIYPRIWFKEFELRKVDE